MIGDVRLSCAFPIRVGLHNMTPAVPDQQTLAGACQGHSFPTCSGVGFRASRPGYEPYFCSDSYRLATRYGERGQQETCVSLTLSKVDGGYCAPAVMAALETMGW